MVVFASSRIIINEIGGNPLLYIDKKHFLDQIREKNANFERFWPIFVSFWPLIGPKLFCFCFHYLFREKLDQNDLSHAMLIPSLYIFIVFEKILFKFDSARRDTFRSRVFAFISRFSYTLNIENTKKH